MAEKEKLVPWSFTRRDVGADDVQIAIDWSGICHSDIHTGRNEWGEINFPLVPGHEIVGRVTAVGGNVSRFVVGQRVGVGVYVDSCRTCDNCVAGMSNYCREGMIGTFDALWAVVLDDLEASEWVANLGITLFVLPLIVLGPIGGRLVQRIGPFTVGPIGLVIAAVFVTLYGLMPSGLWMLAIALVHSVTDGLTVSSTAVAVGMVTPDSRHAGAQGLLGGVQTLLAGVVAVLAGVLYEYFGRVTAYWTAAVIMLVLVATAVVLSGDDRRRAARGGS